MAIKSINNIYGIINASGSISNANAADIAGGPNGTAYFESANVVAVLPYDGVATGFAITGGCRVILSNSGYVTGYVSSKTITAMLTALA